MGWFGLFDLLRFRPGAAVQEGWPLPSSQLRLTDPNLCALYHAGVVEAGHGFHADLFDIAAHHLARATPAQTGGWHVDLRETGRPAALLFGADHGRALLAWHAPTRTATVRLADGAEPSELAHASLDALLCRCLPVATIESLSLWVTGADAFEALMRQIEPWLVAGTRAVVRMPAAALPDVVSRLPRWPARCAAVVPCTRAPDRVGRGEEAGDVILCLEDLSRQTPAAARALALPRILTGALWNEQDRASRSRPTGGVQPALPAPTRALAAGLAIGVLGDVPATAAGTALAAMQATPYRAEAGFDYLLEIATASVFSAGGVVIVAPQTGPVVVDPHWVRAPDRAGAAGVVPAATVGAAPGTDMAGILAASGVLADGRLQIARRHAVHDVSDRVTFLFGHDAAGPLEHVTEIWPQLEYLFQFCERARMQLAEIDVLVPDQAPVWVAESLKLAGIAPHQIHTRAEGVLYRRLLLASPAGDAHAPQRAAAYDQFWHRLAVLRRQAGFTSFSRPAPRARVMLIDQKAAPLVNASGLSAIARDRGYLIVDPSMLGLAALQGILGDARVVVGPGRLLGWTCLAQGCAVGLLQSDADTEVPHAALHAAAARGHAVLATFGTAIGTGAAAGFVVAPDRFMAVLDRIEAGVVVRGGAMEMAR